MVLRHWDPFQDFRRMRENRDRLWRGAYAVHSASREPESWAIPLDVVQEGDNILVQASMPGVNPEDIDVTVEENVLTILGKTQTEQERQEGDYLIKERRTGSFRRSLRLPDTADTEKADSHYEQGVLTVSFPRLESKKVKQLPLTVGEAKTQKK